MKIVVPYDNGMVFGHFGQTKQFKVYETKDSKVTGSRLVLADSMGHQALGKQIVKMNADVIICGGLGKPMLEILKSGNLEVCFGVSMEADKAVEEYLNGTLNYSKDAQLCNCSHEH